MKKACPGREDQKEKKGSLECVDFSGKSRFIIKLLHMFTGALPVFEKTIYKLEKRRKYQRSYMQ